MQLLTIEDEVARELQLTEIVGIAIGPAGDIYAADTRLNAVLVFDSSGGYRGVIGKAGAGPGEFLGITRLGLSGDTVWVVDHLLHRMTLFNLAGRLLDTRQLPASIGRSPNRQRILPSFRLAGDTILAWTAVAAREEALKVVSQRALLRVTADDSYPDTILVLTGEPQVVGLDIPLDGKPRSIYFFRFNRLTPFAEPSSFERGIVVVDPTGRAAGSGYQILLLGYDGRVSRSRFVARPPVVGPCKDHNAQLERIYEDMRRAGIRDLPTRASFVRIAADRLPCKRIRPAATAVLVGEDGSIWVRGPENSKGVRWVRHDVGGGPDIEFTLEPRVQLMHAKGRHVWGVATDEFDRPHIVHLAVSDPPSSAQ